jgi:hypothetical protein
VFNQLTSAYYKSLLEFLYLILVIGLVYFLYLLVTIQPYYDDKINTFRYGTITMIVSMSFGIMFFQLYNINNYLVSFLIFLVGVVLFISGIFFYKKISKYYIRGIYLRLKKHLTLKRKIISDTDRKVSLTLTSEDGKSVDNINDETLSKVSSSMYNSDHLDRNSTIEEEEEEENEEENSGCENENSNSSNDSDSSNDVQIHKILQDKIRTFDSIDNILKSTDKREPIVVFNKPSDFELACRFIKNNEKPEAFQLVYDIYDECTSQFPKNPYINIYYTYYIAYIDKQIDKYVVKMPQNKSSETNNIYGHLINANACKTNFLSKYFIRYIYLDVKDNYEDIEGYSKRNSMEIFEKMQQIAINDHITAINLLKQFFVYIKHVDSEKEKYKFFDLNLHLNSIHKLKINSSMSYQRLINMFPDDKSSLQLYNLLISSIISQPESEEYIIKLKNNTDNKRNKIENNTGITSIDELNDIEISENQIKKQQREHILHKYRKKSKRLSSMIFRIYEIELILYTIMVIFNVFHLNRYYHIIINYSILSDIDYYINNLLSEAKMIILSIMDRDKEMTEEHMDYIENEYLVNFKESYIPLLEEYFNMDVSLNPLVTYNNGKSQFIYLNGFELVKKVELYAYEIINLSYEEWVERVDNGEDLFSNDIFRFLSDNYPNYANAVVQETIDYIITKDSEANFVRKNVIYAGVTFLVVLSLFTLIFGIIPLFNYTKNIQDRITSVFKLLMKRSINELIEKFDDDVNAIIETYDINAETNGKLSEKLEKGKKKINYYYKKVRGVIITFIVLLTVVTISVPVITYDKYILEHVEYNFKVSERKDHVLDIFMFSYETLLQDRHAYLPGEAESRLNNEIKKLEELQENIYMGKLGLSPTIKMSYLDEIFLNHKCFNINMDLCSNITEKIDNDFTEDLIKFNVDEIISEFIERARSILYRSNITYQKTEVDPYNLDYGDIHQFRQRYLNDNDYQFEYDIYDYIIGALKKYEEIIYQIINLKIKDGILCIIAFYIIGISLILFSIVYTRRIIKEANTSLIEIINIAFIIPKSAVDSSPEFKRFIDTGFLDY